MSRIAMFALAISVIGCTGSGGPPAAGSPVLVHIRTPPIDIGELDALIQRVVTEKHLVGVSVGVMQDGEVVLAKGYGFRSLDPNEPVTPSTMFAIGSVTKQFICGAALLLAQDGKLSMRDPVAQYVPRATRASEVTLLDLGQHVSGYRDYYPLDFVNREMQRPETADTIIARYAMRALDFDPGTRWSYNNTNFLILGKAIETASSQSLGAFLAQRIFTPLGMTRTAFDPPATDTGLARGYTSYALAAPTPASPEARGWIGAAGAIWSTPTDLLKWDLALIDGQVLSRDSYAMLTTPRTLADGRTTGYGCGLGVQSGGDALVFQHGGAVAGSVASNLVIPATRSAVVVLANADFAATGAITTAALEQLTPQVDVPTIAGLPALARGQSLSHVAGTGPDRPRHARRRFQRAAHAPTRSHRPGVARGARPSERCSRGPDGRARRDGGRGRAIPGWLDTRAIADVPHTGRQDSAVLDQPPITAPRRDMPAYVVVQIAITDEQAYEQYKAMAPVSIGLYGGRYVVRGMPSEILEGTWQPTRLVILEFPSAERARAWWGSPEYAPAKSLRQRSAQTEMLLIEGHA